VPILLKKGSVFDTKAEIICHGVNCKGGFGSGIAGQIARRWPKVRKAYLDKFETTGWSLGDVLFVYSEHKLKLPIIANIATQENFGYDGQLYADYEAIRIGLAKVLQFASDGRMNYNIALPRIGCGLAGGDWPTVFDIIVSESQNFPNVLVEVYSL